MKKIVTAVFEFDLDTESENEADEIIQGFLDDSTMSHSKVCLDGVELLGQDDGNHFERKPPVHFSDRELAERGLPSFAWATHPSSGDSIRIERGMIGFFNCVFDPVVCNREACVTDAQAEAMLYGSLFGWDSPGSYPDFHKARE